MDAVFHTVTQFAVNHLRVIPCESEHFLGKTCLTFFDFAQTLHASSSSIEMVACQILDPCDLWFKSYDPPKIGVSGQIRLTGVHSTGCHSVIQLDRPHVIIFILKLLNCSTFCESQIWAFPDKKWSFTEKKI